MARSSRRGDARGSRAAKGESLGDGERIARLYHEFYAVVRRIPRGRVATYGQIAELAGHPGAARAVGAAMRASSGQSLPWQRVVGKHSRGLGKVAIHDPIGGTIQRGLLEKEGVTFTPAGYIPLDKHGWIPGEGSPRSGRRKGKRRAVGARRFG